jgi:ABC-2 type transport system ATP-binding protein
VNAIETVALTHRYGERTALDALDLVVEPGAIFGLLGPNGGGKTTLFRILSTLMAPTSGTARVLGGDTVADAAAVRARIGVVFQAPSLDGKLTVAENLRYQGALYGLSRARARERADAMLARVGLSDRRGDRAENLSGGLKRRVELAKGLLHGPELLLLDEPSSGLDPGGRRDLWTYLERIRREDGVTSLVTTHLMEEAERCDRLAILHRGRIVALGAPDALKAEIGGDVVTLETADGDALAAALREDFGVEAAAVGGRLRFEHADAAALVPRLAAAYPGRIATITVGKPTLEDVFVAKTGHRFWEANA